MKELEFFFDFQSPYSYLGFQWLKKNKVLLDHLNIEIKYKPVFLAQVIKYYETKGPAEITSKRNYLFKNCLRYAAKNNIEFNIPKTLPFNSLYILRIVEGASQESKLELIDLFFSAGWQKGCEIGEESSIREILLAKKMSVELMEHSTSKEVRVAMKKNYKNAIRKGVFGVPTFIIDDELFWGNDSLSDLEAFLTGADLLDTKKYDYFIKNYFKEIQHSEN